MIARNVFENPSWYTAYTPYQPEISQGRLEALLNFQTMVADLTGLPVAGASLLDEGTAAAEAMTLAKRSAKSKSNTFLVAGDTHPQTLDVLGFKRKAVSIHWELMFTRPIFATPDMGEQGKLLNEVAALVDAGRIRTTLAEVLRPINAANLKKAHAVLESGTAKGKIVLEGF